MTSNELKKFDGGRFVGVMNYHAHYFKAMAYFSLLEAQFKEANEKGKGMARSVTLATIALK